MDYPVDEVTKPNRYIKIVTETLKSNSKAFKGDIVNFLHKSHMFFIVIEGKIDIFIYHEDFLW